MLFSEPKIPQYRLPREAVPTHFRFSALQRAENSSIIGRPGYRNGQRVRFSALQRAENSSIELRHPVAVRSPSFQCSSASRKFLNEDEQSEQFVDRVFQCSSASRKFLNSTSSAAHTSRCAVSVLFSEPKIPQCNAGDAFISVNVSFSALQRAENSSIQPASRAASPAQQVSVLFSEPKIPQFINL